MTVQSNETMAKFGWPDTLLAEFEHWVVLLRPAQVTAGSLVLAAKSEATAFGALDPPTFADLARATQAIEAVLAQTVGYERINYLMLMMVDPHVHFHVLPRYEGKRTIGSLTLGDPAWPGPPDVKQSKLLDTTSRDALVDHLKTCFREFLNQV